ncbi:MAG: hypothetical protein VYD57_09620 [Pseudomonadota bacterium]|nr:hypothetical protein [Pseudomonadota bacterium]
MSETTQRIEMIRADLRAMIAIGYSPDEAIEIVAYARNVPMVLVRAITRMIELD